MTRCKLHGGASFVGTREPHFRHGERESLRRFPDKIRERAEQLFEDPNLISLRDRIAVNDARERELLETLDNGTPSSTGRALVTPSGRPASQGRQDARRHSPMP